MGKGKNGKVPRAHAAALNFVEGSQPLFDFNNGALYGNGIATVTVTAVPEPASVAALLLGLASAAAVSMRSRLG